MLASYVPKTVLKSRGFTLIELMVVIAIVGILATVSYPAYTSHVIKANRAAAQSFMLEVAQRQQNHMMNSRTYATSLIDLGLSLPDDVTGLYALDSATLGVEDGPPPSFTLQLNPVAGSMQADDGSLCISNAGARTRRCQSGGTAESW